LSETAFYSADICASVLENGKQKANDLNSVLAVFADIMEDVIKLVASVSLKGHEHKAKKCRNPSFVKHLNDLSPLGLLCFLVLYYFLPLSVNPTTVSKLVQSSASKSTSF
jgi:hypothetical protein